MRNRQLAMLLSGIFLLGGALWACGSSSSTGPSAIGCAGGTPDLTGTWTLDTIEFVGQGAPLYPPTATGTFTFSHDTVQVTLNVPNPGAPPPTINIGGSGNCTLAGNHININSNSIVLGQATGTYTYVQEHPAAADTLHATLVSTGQTIRVVVTR